MNLPSVINRFKRQIISFEGEPAYIAKGFALGSFIGMLPIPGFHILSSLTLGALLKLNKKSVFLGVIKTNLFTAGFIFSFNYWIGKSFLGTQPKFVIPNEISFDFLRIVFASGIEAFQSLLVGGIIMGIISAVVNYYIVFYWIKNYRSYAVS
ncbi:DUF2062 domain-containing protein [Moheibacter sediminis]|uniref:Uncharacterized conserved protein, DUF2062 family n=1 Tax=Moheibacter sediminis TaxID=1434700 RepID=A0A1W2C4X7_9FLAO|nr:DUF2062 domain-containing protein [Moheibacter sediminis]SMC80317.1 Uncharacterized conserved protein, DUF2062 family [Moheibacter sediminis]